MSVSLSRSTSYSSSNSTQDTLPNPGHANQAASTSSVNEPINIPATRVRILSASSAQQSVPHRKSSLFFGENVDKSTVLEARKVSTLPNNEARRGSVNSNNKTVEIELQVLNDDISASSPQAIEPLPLKLSAETTDAFFKSLQAAEDVLGTGRRYLESLQELGFKDDLLTKLSDSLDQIKDVIDRAKDLKQNIDKHEILEVARAVSELDKELQEASASLKSLFAEAVQKIEELSSCCSGFFSCFGKKK